jgi:hypothetical protein
MPAHLSKVHHRPLKFFASPLKLPKVFRPLTLSPGLASAQPASPLHTRPGPLRPGNQARRSPSEPGAMAMACQAGRPAPTAIPPRRACRARQGTRAPYKARHRRPWAPCSASPCFCVSSPSAKLEPQASAGHPRSADHGADRRKPRPP